MYHLSSPTPLPRPTFLEARLGKRSTEYFDSRIVLFMENFQVNSELISYGFSSFPQLIVFDFEISAKFLRKRTCQRTVAFPAIEAGIVESEKYSRSRGHQSMVRGDLQPSVRTSWGMAIRCCRPNRVATPSDSPQISVTSENFQVSSNFEFFDLIKMESVFFGFFLALALVATIDGASDVPSNYRARIPAYEGQCLLACPEGFFSLGIENGCYAVFDDQYLEWDDAQTFCASLAAGGRLVEFETPHELGLVKDHLLEGDYACGGGYWIGAEEIGRTSIFSWASSGQGIGFYDWVPGQPNEGISGEAILLSCADNCEYCASLVGPVNAAMGRLPKVIRPPLHLRGVSHRRLRPLPSPFEAPPSPFEDVLPVDVLSSSVDAVREIGGREDTASHGLVPDPDQPHCLRHRSAQGFRDSKQLLGLLPPSPPSVPSSLRPLLPPSPPPSVPSSGALRDYRSLLLSLLMTCSF
ncbi:unnamed protein product [Cyprideis torosa]|uniref:Uncharacterized protein n=1 Tax=Cyprideis torosa TaxID=163714 RepID=A0A7R8WS05_9CRUS|nr:unnamed protein product [Cyprideis torosa]CAG0903201.1 unnamed protein product [Cyprideis torosa]